MLRNPLKNRVDATLVVYELPTQVQQEGGDCHNEHA